MRQRELEIALQKLEGFPDPKPSLEQYPTPAKVAADILYTAHALGDIQGRSVIDLGCGPGIFSIGAFLLGAEKVTGLDIDQAAVSVAVRNAQSLGCDIDFLVGPVEAATGHYDTCIMNPPFGSQTRHADIPFLEKAMEIADVVYSMHNSGTMEFIGKLASSKGREITHEKKYKLEIRHTFAFHRKERQDIDVTLVRMVRH